jgi:CheY-like chemotaxis protein
VALARARLETFDLVVSGLNNAGMSGFDLCAALRANPAYHEVAIILASADPDPESARRASECGARALVRKGTLSDGRLSQVLAEINSALAA